MKCSSASGTSQRTRKLSTPSLESCSSKRMSAHLEWWVGQDGRWFGEFERETTVSATFQAEACIFIGGCICAGRRSRGNDCASRQIFLSRSCHRIREEAQAFLCFSRSHLRFTACDFIATILEAFTTCLHLVHARLTT